MKILHQACLNNGPEFQSFLGPKCAPVGGEPPKWIFIAQTKYSAKTNCALKSQKSHKHRQIALK